MYENQWKVEGEVKDVALIEPKEAGNWPSLAVKFEYAQTSEDGGELKTITAFMFFTEKAIQYTEEDLRTLGWDPIKESWQIDSLIESKAIIGAKARLVLAEEEYQGKRHVKVKFINPLTAKLKGMEAKPVSDFTKALQKRLGVSGKPKPAAAAKPATAKTAPPPEAAPAMAADDPDNIPF